MAEQINRGSLPDNAIRICIDHYGDKDIAGRMYSGRGAEERHFISMTEFLIKADELLDKRGRPQSFQTKRTFQKERRTALAEADGESEEKAPADERQGQTGNYATYDIMVLSRMHTSWQGFVRDEAGGFVGEFESELQLMELLFNRLKLETESVGNRR